MKKYSILYLLIYILLSTLASGETVIEVYEMSYEKANSLGNNYNKIYKETQKISPSEEVTYKDGKVSNKKKNFHSDGVSIVFSKGKTDTEKFNLLLGAVAKFSREKMKNNNGKGISKFLLQLKQ